MSYFSPYHNTTDTTGKRLRQFEGKAADQEALILRFFQDRLFESFTPSEVWQTVLPSAPLTSVRRAITNLTRSGRLVKTETQRMGPYGRPEYVWRLK